MKSFGDLLQPDLPIRLADIYGAVSEIRLDEAVPDDVRNYMESIKTLAVFGHFHSRFFMHAVFLSTTALEMALRARFPMTGEDKRTMHPLIEEARHAQLLQDSALRKWQKMKRFRNDFLHRKQSTILTPWMAIEFLSHAAEIINGLFAHGDSKPY